MNVKTLAFALSSTLALGAFAAEYAVPKDGTLDEVIGKAVNKDDVIRVAPGDYTTTTKYGPNLKAKLIGTGASRDKVVIRSSAGNRTLRMDVDSWLENVTVYGNPTSSKVDKGGAIEMSGGTVTNCVITGGTAYGNDYKHCGGNLYLNNSAILVVGCEISGGQARKHGGNVCIDGGGTVRKCTITGGVSGIDSTTDEPRGANVYMYKGVLENCTITGGTGAERGGNVYIDNTAAVVTGCTIADGTVSKYGGNLFMRDGNLISCLVTNGTCNASGGNVYIQAGSIKDCQMGGGSTKNNEGGSVYMTGGTIDGLFAVCNGSVKGSGGCVWMNGGTLKNSHLVGGTATGYYGGTLYMDGGTAQDTVLEGGVSSREGGNLYMKKGTATRLTISGGKATNDGGNVRLMAGALSDSTITDGTIGTGHEKKGANVYMDDASTLSRCVLKGGSSENDYDGGSLCAFSNSAVVEDCLVSGSACGGILYGTAAKTYNTTIVANEKYGVWCWGGGGQTFINTVVFGNTNKGSARDWTGDKPSAVERLLNCAVASGTVDDKFTTTVIIGESAFVDFASGDYRPTRMSALTNAGATDPRGAAASTIDLLGKPRVIEKIDIGAYEYQPSGLLVTIDSVEKDHVYVPATFVFTHSSANSTSPENVKFKYDFGDGSVSELTSELKMTHVYTNPGTYTVKITAVDECEGEEAEQTYEAYVKTTSSKVYVTLGNANAAFPYDTPETGYATIADAMKDALDDYVLQLPRGVYEVAGQIDLTKKITLRGLTGKPTDVVLHNTVETPDGYKYRVLQVGLGARAENLTIENGRVKNQYGACLRVAGGTVSNCVIRAGVAVVDNGNAAGGGVCLGGQGSVITHCVISGNAVQGTSTENKDYSSGAVFIENSSMDCRISNCLIVDNVYVPSSDSTAGGTAGVRFGGRNDHTALENCTIAGNRVEGSLPDDSAGLYCTTWHSYVRNCVIAGNYETGKAKYTSAKLDFSSGSGFSYLNNLTDDTLIPESGTKSVGHRLENDHTRIFKNLQKGDYRPVPGGATVNAGTDTLAFPAEVDLLGSARAMFKAIDIGCYECQRQAGLSIVIK